MHKTRLIAYLLLIVTFVGVSIANGGELQKNGFSISLPDGWVEIPRDVLDAGEKEVAKLAPNISQHNDCGFQLGSSKDWFEYPYIIIRIQNTGRVSEKELEGLQGYSLSGEKEIENLKKDISFKFNDLEVGKTVYDKRTKMLWARMEANEINVGPTSTMIGMVPTEKGFIFIYGYSLKKDYPIYESVFQSVAVSVIPEPGLAYKVRWSDNLPPAVSRFEPGSGRFKLGSEPDGFRGIKWGADISTLPDMEYISTDPNYGGMEAYKKKNDKLEIGGTILKSISYAFWKGKFEDVLIEVKGSVAWNGLKEAVFAKFGQVHQGDKDNLLPGYTEKYLWFGKTTAMVLNYDESSKEGTHCMFSIKIRNQQEEYNKVAKAKKSAGPAIPPFIPGTEMTASPEPVVPATTRETIIPEDTSLTILIPTGKEISVVLDPAFGGTETGAVGAWGLKEKDVTLDVAIGIKACLEKANPAMKVYLTRINDESVSEEEREKFIQAHSSALVVKLRLNSSSREDASGLSVCYDKGSEKSKRLAEIISTKTGDIFMSDIVPNEGIKPADIYKNIQFPVAEVFFGYITNPNIEANLKDPAVRRAMSWSVGVAIAQYLR